MKPIADHDLLKMKWLHKWIFLSKFHTML